MQFKDFKNFKLNNLERYIDYKNNSNYAIKARVCYMNREGQKWSFAKIRISLGFNGKIQIGGERSGSWQQSDYYDTDFLQNPDPELNLVLES